MHIFGIDVGLSGGIGYINTDANLKTLQLDGIKMPITKDTRMPDYNAILEFFLTKIEANPSQKVFVFIENVHAYGGQGVVSTFTFGKAFGFMLGFLDSLSFVLGNKGIKFEYICLDPKTWQREFNLIQEKKITTKEKKLKHGVALLSIYPSSKKIVVTRRKGIYDGIVDALLMAEFSRRLLNNEIDSIILKELKNSDTELAFKDKIKALETFEEQVTKYYKRIIRQTIKTRLTRARHYCRDAAYLRGVMDRIKQMKKRYKDILKDYTEMYDPSEVVGAVVKKGG